MTTINVDACDSVVVVKIRKTTKESPNIKNNKCISKIHEIF